MGNKHMPHTHKKAFHTKPLFFSHKLISDGDNTLIILPRESGKTVQKSDFDFEVLQRVGFQIKRFLCQIFNKKTTTFYILK